MRARFPLTEPQERHLATILGHLERAVRELQDEAGRAPQDLALTQYEDAIDSSAGECLRDLIAGVEAGVKRIAGELGLPRSRSSILRQHLARLQLLSIDLYATLPSQGLTSYGEAAPATARYLEEEIPQPEALVRQIRRVLEGER